MNTGTKWVIGIIAVVVIAAGAFTFLTAPDERTAGEHLSDAAESLDEGVDDAARELEDRTPAQRFSDEVEDATDGDAN